MKIKIGYINESNEKDEFIGEMTSLTVNELGNYLYMVLRERPKKVVELREPGVNADNNAMPAVRLQEPHLPPLQRPAHTFTEPAHKEVACPACSMTHVAPSVPDATSDLYNELY